MKNLESTLAEFDQFLTELFSKALAQSPRSFNNQEEVYGKCPAHRRFVEVAVSGRDWDLWERNHIKQPCPFCMRTMELQWRLACPSESTLEESLKQDFLFADPLSTHLDGCESCRDRLRRIRERFDDIAVAAQTSGAIKIPFLLLDEHNGILKRDVHVEMSAKPELRDGEHLVLNLRLPEELAGEKYRYRLVAVLEGAAKPLTGDIVEPAFEGEWKMDLHSAPPDVKKKWPKTNPWPPEAIVNAHFHIAFRREAPGNQE